jgi:hypothetical protein
MFCNFCSFSLFFLFMVTYTESHFMYLHGPAVLSANARGPGPAPYLQISEGRRLFQLSTISWSICMFLSLDNYKLELSTINKLIQDQKANRQQRKNPTSGRQDEKGGGLLIFSQFNWGLNSEILLKRIFFIMIDHILCFCKRDGHLTRGAAFLDI